MGNFAENLNLGNRFRPPPVTKKPYFDALYNLMLYFSDFCEKITEVCSFIYLVCLFV